MTPQQRTDTFRRLYATIPGSGRERIERICNILYCKPNTVRVWHMKHSPRPIPYAKLRILTERL